MQRLSGQVAIVTGGGSGIGRATCGALARAGSRVVIVDVNPQGLEETRNLVAKQAAGEAPLALCLDVRREADMDAMARQTLEHFGRIDVLVAAAGILRPSGSGPKRLVDLSLTEWEAVLDTNLKGVFLSNRAVLPAMIRQRRGAIVNVSSVAGRVGRAYDSAYCASKFGVIGLSEALAEEVRSYNVRVQVVLPDAVDTPLWAQNSPLPRPPSALPAERVADFIVYLLSLPEDTILVQPIIAPFQARRRKRREEEP
ncbi:MAG: hypothetical protein KatS3mg131_0062 [Candidatus Tectimicrobiota bacterium]|nr:MAG: hypothetical protein KatS3mg131_0062 [Candidatus Tectomicrobia bacterium]